MLGEARPRCCGTGDMAHAPQPSSFGLLAQKLRNCDVCTCMISEDQLNQNITRLL